MQADISPYSWLYHQHQHRTPYEEGTRLQTGSGARTKAIWWYELPVQSRCKYFKTPSTFSLISLICILFCTGQEFIVLRTNQEIHGHIMSYHPALPHPLYLNPCLSAIEMWRDYQERSREPCQVQVYQREVKRHIISFARTGEWLYLFCRNFCNHVFKFL